MKRDCYWGAPLDSQTTGPLITTKCCIGWNWNQGQEKRLRHEKSQRSQNYTVGIFLVSENSETWKSLTMLAQEISDPKSETCFGKNFTTWIFQFGCWMDGVVRGAEKHHPLRVQTAPELEDAGRWWQLKDFLECSPRILGKMKPFWLNIFPKGLVQPPTSKDFSFGGKIANPYKSRELTYPLKTKCWVDDFPLLKVGGICDRRSFPTG